MEEGDQEIESSLTEEMAMSQQEPSKQSDKMDESSEESVKESEKIQVERDSSLKPSLNQEDMMLQEEEIEEEEEEEGEDKEKVEEREEEVKRKKKKKEEEEKEQEEEEEHEDEEKQGEEEEEHESLFMEEVGQQWIHSWVWGKHSRLTLCIPITSWGPQWCSLHWDLQMFACLLFCQKESNSYFTTVLFKIHFLLLTSYSATYSEVSPYLYGFPCLSLVISFPALLSCVDQPRLSIPSLFPFSSVAEKIHIQDGRQSSPWSVGKLLSH